MKPYGAYEDKCNGDGVDDEEEEDKEIDDVDDIAGGLESLAGNKVCVRARKRESICSCAYVSVSMSFVPRCYCCWLTRSLWSFFVFQRNK